jgi:hypothetical protein
VGRKTWKKEGCKETRRVRWKKGKGERGGKMGKEKIEIME